MKSINLLVWMSTQRRIQLTLAAIPSPLLAQNVSVAPKATPLRVAAGTDREGKKHAIGLSSTTYKVLT